MAYSSFILYTGIGGKELYEEMYRKDIEKLLRQHYIDTINKIDHKIISRKHKKALKDLINGEDADSRQLAIIIIDNAAEKQKLYTIPTTPE